MQTFETFECLGQNFHASSQKSEYLHFDRLLLPKKYNVLDEKVQ